MSPRNLDHRCSHGELPPSIIANGFAAKRELTATPHWYFVRLSLLPVLLFGFAGCGGSVDGIAPVRGVVTLDGKPLTEGFVVVTPADGKMAKGAIESDGTFVLGTDTDSDGAKTGTHPVSVLPPPAQEGMPLSATAKMLPRQYSSARTSGITVKVEPNTDNELSIELSTE